MHLDVATGGELARRARRRGARRAARAARQQQVGRRAARRRSTAGSGGSWSTRSTSSTASRRWSPRAAAPPTVLRAGHARASRPTPTSSCRPARTTRSSGSGWRRAPPTVALDRRAVVAARSTLVGLHVAHRQPGVRGRVLRSWPSTCWPLRGQPVRPARAVGGRRARRRLRRGRGGPDHHRVGRRRSAGPATGPGITRHGHRRAGPGHRRRAPAVTLYTVGTIKELPGIRTYVSVDGGMSDNPRPVLYGSGYETFLPARRRGRAAAGRCASSASTASRATCSVREAEVPADLAVGDVVPRRSPAPTATRWAPTTTRCPGPRWCSSRDGEARVVVRRETYDDLLTTDLD